MAEQAVRIEGVVSTTASGIQSVALVTPTPLPVTGFLSTNTIKDPAMSGVYIFAPDALPGVLTANNYISVFNPLGSGKTLSLTDLSISSITAGGSAAFDPMRIIRTTSASGGVLQAASAISKYVTAAANTVAQVRTGNPTVTLDGVLFNAPPAVSSSVTPSPMYRPGIPGAYAPFSLVPGEGIVFRTTTGDVDQRWNLSVSWGDI